MKRNRCLTKHNSTEHIAIDTEACEACWKCIAVCTSEVISRVNIFFHKHSKINKRDLCKGCMKCVKVCEYEAISSLSEINISET